MKDGEICTNNGRGFYGHKLRKYSRWRLNSFWMERNYLAEHKSSGGEERMKVVWFWVLGSGIK
jgi:hypothetical protein